MSASDVLRSELLRQFRESGLSQRAFEQKLGLARWSLRGMLDEQMAQTPRLDKAEQISRALGLELSFGSAAEPPGGEIDVQGAEFSTLPLYAAEGSAGPGSFDDKEEVRGRIAFRLDWLKRQQISPSQAGLISIRGDSMAPTLEDGDAAMFDMARSDVQSGRVYAFVDTDGSFRVKRLELPKKRLVILRSDNPAYQVELRSGVDATALRILGEIRWSAHTWN
ncbi:LexA family transcriptional regulator [Pseudoroseicyclus sp. H15]